MERIKERLKTDALLTEEALARYMSREDNDIKSLLESERYSVFAGGKRIRPFLVLEFCRMFGGKDEAALPFAAAIEMIHTYSLIHDDLPCMDDDDLRRGRPTNHKVFGYSTALLAGDGLLTRAFGVAAANGAVTHETRAEAVALLSECAGEFGMVGGQVIDLFGETQKLSLETLIKLHSMKTGALIRASALFGCLAAGLSLDSPEADAAREYAANIGLAFQIIDDVLDVTSSEEELGKTCGSDGERNKTTFMTYFDIDGARAYAAQLTSSAISEISEFADSEVLTDLAIYLLERNN